METKISEIADGIYRLSTYVPDIAPPAGFTFNQFLVLGDEPLMFHTGLRKMFLLNRDALSRIISPERLRWIAFGHFEADESVSSTPRTPRMAGTRAFSTRNRRARSCAATCSPSSATTVR